MIRTAQYIRTDHNVCQKGKLFFKPGDVPLVITGKAFRLFLLPIISKEKKKKDLDFCQLGEEKKPIALDTGNHKRVNTHVLLG